MKKLLTLLIILPLLVYCKPETPEVIDDDNNTEQNKDDEKDPNGDNNGNNSSNTDDEEVDVYEGAATELKDGDTVQSTNPLVQKFISEVSYQDKTYKQDTKIFDYYGGFDGKNLTWDNWDTEWPDGDKPLAYSIRWTKEDLETGKLLLHLEDKLTSWSGEMEIKEGSCYVNITNLVPNDQYSYKVTTASGKVVAQGNFSTTGSVHQCYFTGTPQKKKKEPLKGEGVRNCRDLGGWVTESGKTIKYRKVYRGGRLNDRWDGAKLLNKQGRLDVAFEGIAAQLELRGSDDYMSTPALDGMDFLAPVIEEGGKVMLGVQKPSAKNCAKWLKYDQGREDIANVSDYAPTQEEFDAFQTAYKAKTKQCFEFVANSVKNNKPVYFHCSLGRDRTGTMSIMIMGILGVREGDIAKEYELTYFAPVGYSVSSSDKESNPEPIFKNTRMAWVYSDIVPYFWEMAGSGSFADGVENYLVNVAGVSKATIDEFRANMLQ